MLVQRIGMWYGNHTMSGRTEFSQYMEIPLRTLEEWEAGRRQMPEYVLRLIAYYARMECFLKEKGIEMGDEEDETK